MNKPTDLRQRLESGQRLLLAEISPPAEAAPAGVQQLAKRFAGKIHALGISDNRDRVGMAALAAASLVAGQGVEPILHVTTRDRNRIALVSEILGARAGHPQHPLYQRYASDAGAIPGCQERLRRRRDPTLANLRQLGKRRFPGWRRGHCRGRGILPGAVASPNADPLELQMIRLGKKVSAGAGSS